MKKITTLVLCILLSLASQAQRYGVFETIDFATKDSLLAIDTTLTNNIWQIGNPSKTFFNSAYSVPNAIVTDTLGFYPRNNYSTFKVTLYDSLWNEQPLNACSVRFMYKFDTDSLKDGGYVEISYDGGKTWTNIANDPLVNTINHFYYDNTHYLNPVISNGNAAYTGKSNGWKQGELAWCWNWNNPQSVILRFVFSSDSIQTNKEGWMIDNIELIVDICEGIPEFQKDNLISISPNPVSTQLTVDIKDYSDKNAVQIFDALGQCVYNNQDFKDKTIDTQQLQNGYYFLKYANNDSFAVKKFVVMH